MADTQLNAIVQKMIDAGEPEENIATVINGYKPETVLSQQPRSWTDTAVDTLPYIGGTLGGIVGTAGGPVGTVGGAALGGAAGEAWKQNINRMRGAEAPRSAGDAAQSIARSGAVQGAGAVAGGVASKVAGKALGGVMNFATSPTAKLTGANIGRVVGGIVPAAEGVYDLAHGDLKGAAYGLTGAAAGAWVGGRTGWFTAKLAQKLAAPIANAGGLSPFVKTLGQMGAQNAVAFLTNSGLSKGEATATFHNMTHGSQE